MRSMTGLGHGSAESDRIRATVTLRGVNHRYLDLVLRIRDEYRDAEPALRSLFAGRLERGRVEAVVEIEPLGAVPVEVMMNEELVETLHGLLQSLVERGLVHGGLSFADLLRLPEVIKLRPREAAEWLKADEATVLLAAERALEQLVAARETEGGNLKSAFIPRLDGLAEIAGRLARRRAAVADATYQSLKGRIEELLRDQTTGAISEDRLAQEVAYLVDRSDVAEELDRLASHLEHFRAIMEAEGSLGKRLDFLAQEIFRELNTLGSKCRDSEMIRDVLDGKALCEQIREQVQNVE